MCMYWGGGGGGGVLIETYVFSTAPRPFDALRRGMNASYIKDKSDRSFFCLAFQFVRGLNKRLHSAFRVCQSQHTERILVKHTFLLRLILSELLHLHSPLLKETLGTLLRTRRQATRITTYYHAHACNSIVKL